MTPENLKDEKEITVKTVDKNGVVTSRARASRTVKGGMFDLPEIVALSVSGAALFSVILAYFFLLVPAREDFKKREAERSTMQTQLINLQQQSNETLNKEAGTVELVGSVERFENNHLALPAQGNAALYGRLNELIRVNGLRNTAGPEYSPLEIIDAERANRNEERGTKAKQQSLYPGTAVSVTVEGSYANLRRFISSLENTRQFIVINAVEIESNAEAGSSGSDDSAEQPINNPTMMPNAMPQTGKVNPRAGSNPMPNPVSPQPLASTPNRRGAVSMRLELAAYFRRQPAIVQN